VHFYSAQQNLRVSANQKPTLPECDGKDSCSIELQTNYGASAPNVLCLECSRIDEKSTFR
jgi:hypothetical protein